MVSKGENMRIEEIQNPVDRFAAFIMERELIRLRRTAGKPWPWTEDDILQDYRFTNVHREDDTVSQHYQDTVRNRYGENPLVFPASVAYRWFNRPSTCDALFSGNRSVFESYIDTGNITILQECIGQLEPPYVTGSYIITGKPGYAKVDGVIYYIHHWCQKGWHDRWNYWRKDPPLLSEMYEWINSEGLGSFMRGQIIADLKYVPFMKNVKDWWIWATPGPGSLRGLNIVLERPMTESWPKGEWLTQLIRLNDIITPMLEKGGISRLHNQDLQNCLCEFSKYTKVARGWGRPRQTFKNRGI
jgi:hypothetical protein